MKIINKILEWLRSDGVLHLGVCALLTIIFGSFLPLYGAVIIAFFAGFGKEAYDNTFGTGWDWHDFLCDLIGIALGCLVWVLYLLF